MDIGILYVKGPKVGYNKVKELLQFDNSLKVVVGRGLTGKT